MSSEHSNGKKGPKKSMTAKVAQYFSVRIGGPPSPPPRPLISYPQPFDQRKLRPGDLVTLREKQLTKGKEKKGGSFREVYAAAKIAAEAAVAPPAVDRTPHKKHRHRSSREKTKPAGEPVRDPSPFARMQFTRGYERPGIAGVNPQPTGETIRPLPPVANTPSNREEVRRRPVPPPAASTSSNWEDVHPRPLPSLASIGATREVVRRRPLPTAGSVGESRQEENRHTRWSDFASPQPTAPQPPLPTHLSSSPPDRKLPALPGPVQTVPHYNVQLVHPAYRHEAPHQSMHAVYDRSSTARSTATPGTRSWACQLCHTPGAAHPNSGLCEPCMINGRYAFSSSSSSSGDVRSLAVSFSGVSSLSENYCLSDSVPPSPTSVYSRTTTLYPLSRDSALPPLPLKPQPNASHAKLGHNSQRAPNRIPFSSNSASSEYSVSSQDDKAERKVVGNGCGRKQVRDSDASWKETYRMWQRSEEESSRSSSPVPKYEGIGSGEMGLNNRRSSFYGFYSDLVTNQGSNPREDKGKGNRKATKR